MRPGEPAHAAPIDALRAEVAELGDLLRAMAAKLPVSPTELDYGEVRAVFGQRCPSERTFRNLVERGVLSDVKSGGRRLYRLAEVRDYLRGEVRHARRTS